MKKTSFLRYALSLLLLCLVGTSPGKPIEAAPSEAAPAIELMRVPNGGIQPQVMVTGKTVHLVYLSGSPKASDVFYVRSDDEGRSWSAPLRVNSQAGSAIAMGAIRGAQLAVGRGNRVFVMWNGSDVALPRNEAAPASQKFGASPLLFSRLNEAGTAFEPQRNLMTHTFNLDGGGSIAADSSGAVYVAWHAQTKGGQDESTRQVFLAISRDEGATFAPEKAVWEAPTGACGCCQLRLYASAGRLGLLYRSAINLTQRDTYFLFSTDGGRTFAGSKIHPWNINYCPMSSYAMAQQSGPLLAAWESEKEVYFAPLSDKGTAAQIVAAPGQGANRKYPALATNAQGKIALLWTEDTAWARGGHLHGELFDAKNQPVEALGSSPTTPPWSFPAVFTRADGSFAVLY